MTNVGKCELNLDYRFTDKTRSLNSKNLKSYSSLRYHASDIFSRMHRTFDFFLSCSLSFIVIILFSILSHYTIKLDLFNDFINIVCKTRSRTIFKKRKSNREICYLLFPRQFRFRRVQLKLKCDGLIPFWYIFLPYLRRTQMTQSADAENSDRPKSIPCWPTTPWPSFQLNPFAVKDDKEQSKQHSFCFF